MELGEVFDDEGAPGVLALRGDLVEGDDEGVAELAEVAAEPEGGVEGHEGALDELRGEGADDGAVRADEEGVGVQAQVAQDGQGVGVAAAGGDGDRDAGVLGGAEGGYVALADLAVGAEQGAVEVHGDHAGVACCFGHG